MSVLSASRQFVNQKSSKGGYSLNSASVVEGWASFLSRYPWDLFGSHTFRKPMGTEGIVKGVRWWLYESCRRSAVSAGLGHFVKRRHYRWADGRRKPCPGCQVCDGGFRNVFAGKLSNAWRVGRQRPVYVIAVERGDRYGRLHGHSLVRLPAMLRGVFSRRNAWRLWYETFGLGRFEEPRSQEDVAGYCSKYVVQGGELVLSDSFVGDVGPESVMACNVARLSADSVSGQGGGEDPRSCSAFVRDEPPRWSNPESEALGVTAAV